MLNAKRISYWSAKELVYTSAHPRTVESVRFLREIATTKFGIDLKNQGTRRLYVSRKDGLGRHVHNNDEVLALLKPLGFEEVVLSPLTVKEQMQLFADAEFIISPHGAGLLNGVFSGAETKVIELFSPRLVVPPLYQQLVQLMR